MKNYILIFAFLFSVSFASAQDSSEDLLTDNLVNGLNVSNSKDIINTNGFEFTTFDAGINTKFSEFGSGFFMNKFIMVSSKKLGGLAKVDKNTNEGYKNLFCLDVKKNGSLKLPLLFSRIINTRGSEGQVSFSPDEKTMYFTRATEDNSMIYKLYKVTLEEGSHGNWINQEMLDIDVEGYSFENPYVSKTGKELYFSSNMPGGLGGYDLYVATIKADGTLDTPRNLGNTINTKYDDKYPSLSLDGEYLYFSSKGHRNIGGFDVFKSKITKKGYRAPLNLGNTVNTKYDEVAYFMASNNKGYISSNKASGKGSYDIYKFSFDIATQNIKGRVLDLDTQIPLPNTVVMLLDEEGEEIARQTTGDDATYSFDVTPFENYTIKTTKDGFDDASIAFTSNKGDDTTYKKNLELNSTKAEIVEVEDKLMISIENIYFDYAKWSIKQESQISLNKILTVLNENPEMKIEINAHTDNRGNNSYNLNLSKKRAASAMKYLIEKGINADRLISNGYGETQPLVDCKSNCTKEEYQANRRIEFIILD